MWLLMVLLATPKAAAIVAVGVPAASSSRISSSRGVGTRSAPLAAFRAATGNAVDGARQR